MFENLKKLKQLKEIGDSLKKEKIEIERDGIKIIMNGKMEIEEVRLNPELRQDEQEIILKNCINEAIRKIQMLVAQKMMQI